MTITVKIMEELKFVPIYDSRNSVHASNYYPFPKFPIDTWLMLPFFFWFFFILKLNV